MNQRRAFVFQRSALHGRRTGWGVTLVLLGMLWTSVSLFLPATAHAQTKHLELFMTNRGWIYYNDIWGFDVLAAPRDVYNPFAPNSTETYTFVGGPTVVSDQPGRLWLASRTDQGYLAYDHWSWWESLGQPGHALTDGTDPVAAASGWGIMDVFVWGFDGGVLYDRS